MSAGILPELMANERLARTILQVRPAFVGSWLKRLFRLHRIEASTPVGRLWLDPASNFGSRMLSGESYEPSMTAALRESWQLGGSFLDIGANEGYFCLLASEALGPKGTILAVEPQGRLQEVLHRNFHFNKVRAEVVKVGLASQPGTAELNLFPDTNTGATSFARPVSYKLPTETVEVTTLDALLEGRSHFDVAKVDIEGFEAEMFRGATRVLADRQVKRWVIELHPDILGSRGESVDTVRSLLTEQGYEWTRPEPDLAVATLPG